MKKPQIESAHHEDICVNNAMVVALYIRLPCLDFSMEHSYNNSVIETASHNTRHKVKAYAIDRDTDPAKFDCFR